MIVSFFTGSIHANACRDIITGGGQYRIAADTHGEKIREKRLKVSDRGENSRALKRSRSWHVSAMIYTVRGFRT